MDDFVNKLMAEVDIDQETAEKVAHFVKDHVTELPHWLLGKDLAQGMMGQMAEGVMEKLKVGLGGMMQPKKG